jgi:hypothetical protein
MLDWPFSYQFSMYDITYIVFFSVCGIKKISVMCNAILLVHISQTINWQGTLMPFHFDRFMTSIYLVVHAFFLSSLAAGS